MLGYSRWLVLESQCVDAGLELVDGVGKAMCGCWGTAGGSCLNPHYKLLFNYMSKA